MRLVDLSTFLGALAGFSVGVLLTSSGGDTTKVYSGSILAGSWVGFRHRRVGVARHAPGSRVRAAGGSPDDPPPGRRGPVRARRRGQLLTILLETPDLLVVNKPAGLTVIPARDSEPGETCLQEQLEKARGERLWIVHRIDRDTSGALVFARNAEAHRELNLAFEGRAVEKRYVAWVLGAPIAGMIDVPLHEARKGKMRPALPDEAGAKPAVTEILVEQQWARAARIEARPKTGRQHQIRVHLRARETPILFDPLYGKRTFEAFAASPCQRLALHARRLIVPGRLDVEAPLPDDLRALDDWLLTL